MDPSIVRFGEFKLKYDPVLHEKLPRAVSTVLNHSPKIYRSPLMGSPGFFVVVIEDPDPDDDFEQPYEILLMGDYNALKIARPILMEGLSSMGFAGVRVTQLRPHYFPFDAMHFIADIPYPPAFTELLNNKPMGTFYVPSIN